MAEHIQQPGILYSMPDEAESNPDSADFSGIYEAHHLAIYRYILARVGHIEDAQDLTAQVFLKAYQRFESYRHDAPVLHWLMGITRHHIIDYYRSTKPVNPLDEVDDIASPAASIEDSFEQRQRLRRITEALNALSEDRREAISMRLFAGLSNQEIAKMMGKSADAVAMLVHRGVQDLQARIGEVENE